MSAQSPVPASNSRAASVALGQVAKWDDFRFRHGNINAAHKADLARVILNTGKPLSPVLLWQPPTDATTESEAERYVLLDGWHRMAAYRAAKWECPIPAIILDGGRRQALTAALSGNSHFVMPMTLEERLGAAWRLVREPVEPRFKVREVASLSWVGKRTVDQMRRRRAEMQAAGSTPTGEWGRDRQDRALWEGDPAGLLTDQARVQEVESLAADIRDLIDRQKHPQRVILLDSAAVDDAICDALGSKRLLYLAQYGGNVEDAEEWLRLMRDQHDTDDFADDEPSPGF